MKKKAAKEVYTLADLRRWENIDPPIRLGVFGDPVAHSLSPQMQNAALKACKIDMQYARFQISPDELQSALELIPELNFVGVNLTVPHKIAAAKFMDEVDDNARVSRAEGNSDNGAFVQAWVWVSDEEARQEPA